MDLRIKIGEIDFIKKIHQHQLDEKQMNFTFRLGIQKVVVELQRFANEGVSSPALAKGC